MAAQAMGMGVLGGSGLTFKRKFRWTFQVDGICGQGKISPAWAKVAARPNLDIEETEINFLNGKMFIPGKGTWQEMTVTYYDTGGNGTNGDTGLDQLYAWIASVYDFTGGNQTGTPGTGNQPNQQSNLNQASKWKDYGATVTLNLYDGCGNTMETWTLLNTWVKAANFGELDYTSSEEVTVELTLRFAWVSLNRAFCGSKFPAPCCTTC